MKYKLKLMQNVETCSVLASATTSSQGKNETFYPLPLPLPQCNSDTLLTGVKR